MGLPDDQVVVVQEETGGAFGGKEDYPSMIATHAALLARKAGRPVRMVYDRHEDLAATTKRHPAVIRHRTGVTRDGLLVAQDIDFVLDAGAYTTLSPVVLSRGGIHATGPYRCPNVRVQARAAMTNTPPNGAFRGFGAPQAEFAAETHLDRIAEALGLSPLEIRRRNAYREGDVTATGQVLRESVAAHDVLEAAVATAEYERIRASHAADAAVAGPDPRSTPGIGIALGWHGAGFTGSGEAHLASVATVELTTDGGILALVALTEMGQGARTVLGQLVAEALDVPAEAVDVVRPDTSRVPNTGPTVASRTTMIGGGLLATAAAHLRHDVEAVTGRPFAESYREYARDHGGLSASEQFHGFPDITWDEATYRGDAYPAYSWSCVVAGVDVDRDTGEVRVCSVVHAVDAGRIVNRVLAEGQVEGGTLQAVGYATIEEIQVRDGAYRNDRHGHLPDPDVARCAADRDRDRGAAVHRGAPRRQGPGRDPHGRARPGGDRRDPRRDRGLDRRPARDAGEGAGGDAGAPGPSRSSDHDRERARRPRPSSSRSTAAGCPQPSMAGGDCSTCSGSMSGSPGPRRAAARASAARARSCSTASLSTAASCRSARRPDAR